MVNRISVGTHHILAAKHLVMSIVPLGFSLYLCTL